MVQGINVNNYSASQLKELKNAGMQGITDDDIKAAEAKEAKNAKASDEAKVSYKIEDDASKENEAKKEVEEAKESGKNLRAMLESLMPKCKTKDEEMKRLKEEIQKYEVQMSDLNISAEDLKNGAEADLNSVADEADKKQNELEVKQGEIKNEEETLNNEVSKGEDADQSVIDNSQSNLETLSGEAQNLVADINKLSKDAQAKVKEAAALKMALLGETMEDVKNNAQSALNNAIDANEYADVTIEKGMEASNITEKDVAKEEGWSKRGGFLGLGKRKGDVEAANKMGNAAIAHGEQLGNSSQGVAKEVKIVAGQYQIGFASTSGINNILSKEYVDTSKMADLKEFDKEGGFSAFINNIKNAKANQEIYDSIADAAKSKNKKKEETKTEPET